MHEKNVKERVENRSSIQIGKRQVWIPSHTAFWTHYCINIIEYNRFVYGVSIQIALIFIYERLISFSFLGETFLLWAVNKLWFPKGHVTSSYITPQCLSNLSVLSDKITVRITDAQSFMTINLVFLGVRFFWLHVQSY